MAPCLHAALDKCFYNDQDELKSPVEVTECITVCVSNIFAPVNCTVEINRKRNLLLVALRPYTTYLILPGALTPWSIIT